MRRSHKSGPSLSLLYWALWIAAILLYLTWPATHLSAYAWNNDEGLYLQRAALANAGYPLYEEVRFNKPPLLVWIIQTAFVLLGTRLAAARLACLFLSLLGFVALGALARNLFGRWTDILTLFITLGIPEVPVRAHAVMSDLPAFSFAVLALAVVVRLRWIRHTIWAAVAGALYGASLLIHPYLIFMGAPLLTGLALSGHEAHSSTRQTVTAFIAFALSAALPTGIVILIFRSPFLTSVVCNNLQASTSPFPLTAEHDLQIAMYLRKQWPLLWLTLVGALALITPLAKWKGLLVTTSWAMATAATLLLWVPMWQHYLLFLVFPLVVTAAGGITSVVATLLSREVGIHDTRWIAQMKKGLFPAAVTGILALFIHQLASPLPVPPPWTPAKRAAKAFIQKVTPQEGFAVSDDPFLVFSADRYIAPPLTEASQKWIVLGHFTDADAIESVLRYRSPTVLFATERLERLDRFEQWVREIALEEQTFEEILAYQLPSKFTSFYNYSAYIGENIHLEGYDLSSPHPAAGTILTVTLYWKCEIPAAEAYHVFVHVTGEENRLVAQHDGQPLFDAYPTDRWVPGTVIPDPHPVQIPPDTPGGRLYIWIGMYKWPSLERLPAFRPDGTRWLHNRVLLTTIVVNSSSNENG